MYWYDWLCIIFAWSVVGSFIVVIGSSIQTGGAMTMAVGWEFVNPVYIHKCNKVNWFGTIMVALFYNLLCPIGSLIYWIYKLCTVGRK